MKQIISLAVLVITALQLNAQSSTGKGLKRNWSMLTVDANYLASSNAKNSKESRPIFGGSGFNGGLSYRYGDRWGITGKAGYAGGKTNTKNAQAFANTLVTTPFTARVAGLKTNWSQFNVTAGPSVMLGKKYKGEITATGGISTGAARTIKIDRYDAQTFVNTVFEATEKKIKPYWEVGASYSFAKISKRTVMGIKGSYGSVGGAFGVIFSIAERDCHGAPCFRCQGAGCLNP